MRVFKGFLGVGVQVGMTILAIAMAAVLAFVTEESEPVYAGIVGMMITLVTVAVTYFIWYQVKRSQTKDMDLRHYKGWLIWMFSSLIPGFLAGGAVGFFYYGIIYYTPWIFIVTIAEGLVLQAIGSFIAYRFIRPL